MSDFLQLTLIPENDGTAEVFAEVYVQGFSGKSSAWFNLNELEKFGHSLSTTYPLKADTPLCLKGGYWNTSPQKSIKQLHLGIKFYCIDQRGQIGCRVDLSTEDYFEQEDNLSVSVMLITNYESIKIFGQQLSVLTNSTISKAILYGDQN